MIPEAAVEAAARSLFENHPISKGHQAWDKKWGDGRIKTQFRADARAALEAATPHMLAEAVHAYAAAGLAVCGVQTGGAISRHDGYDGPAHRITADDRLVTCEQCNRELTP